MKFREIFSSLLRKYKSLILPTLILVVAVSLLSFNFSNIVRASFGTWGDTSLIHGCKNSRGGVTIVGSSDSCNVNETQVTWVKDVDAGSGLTVTRDSSGVTLSLSSTDSSGWVESAETWTYASADDPTFTFTISGDKTGKYSPGMRVKLTQTTAKYFLITAVSYSSPNTTVTVYGGTDYDLANASITSSYFSTVKAPHGFPLDPAKWTVETIYNTSGNQGSPTANTWYNIGSASVNVPIGSWKLSYSGGFGFDSSTQGNFNAQITLSTSNNSESDSSFTSHISESFAGVVYNHVSKELLVTLTTKATYYLNARTTSSGLNFLYSGASFAPTIIRATSSYI